MVEVRNVQEGRPDTPSQRQEAFIERLAFAKRHGGDRSVIDSEAQSHSLSKREVISQRQRKKKEFNTVPRSMARSSLCEASV